MPQKRRNVMDSNILTEIEQSKIIKTATSYEIQHPDIVPAWRDRMSHNSQVCMILLLCMLLVIILHSMLLYFPSAKFPFCFGLVVGTSWLQCFWSWFLLLVFGTHKTR